MYDTTFAFDDKFINIVVSRILSVFQDETASKVLYSEETLLDIDEENGNTDNKLSAFYKEKEAFNSLNDRLKQKYRGEYVAIYQGQIVDADKNASNLLRRFHEKYGNVVLYVGKITGDKIPKMLTPRRIK